MPVCMPGFVASCLPTCISLTTVLKYFFKLFGSGFVLLAKMFIFAKPNKPVSHETKTFDTNQCNRVHHFAVHGFWCIFFRPAQHGGRAARF